MDDAAAAAAATITAAAAAAAAGDAGAAATGTTATTTTTTGAGEEAKVKVHFKAVGGAPILKKAKFLLRSSSTVADVVRFLRDVALKLPERDPLFVYVNQSFAPALDQTMGSLHACFNTNDELVLHYAIQLSWG